MWTVSQQWGEALAFTHDLAVTGAVTLQGEELATFEPATWRWQRSLSGSQITDQMTFTCVDPDGDLFSPDVDAPLRSLGQRVSFMGAVSSGTWEESIPLGVWRIETATPTSGKWRMYRNGAWARPPQTIDVDAVDLLELIAEYDWLGVSSPPAGATSLTEIKRVVDGALPVRLGTTSKTVAAVPWEGSRIDALLSLATEMDAVVSVDRTGVLTTTPQTGTGATITVSPTSDPDGIAFGLGLIDWKAPSSRDDVYNGVVMTGTDPAGDTLYGRALESDGPLAWSASGYGRKLYNKHSPLLTTQGQVNQAAATLLKTLQRRRAQVVTITTIPNFAVDILDTAHILVPGADSYVDGLVTSLDLSSDGPMTVEVSIPWEDQISV